MHYLCVAFIEIFPDSSHRPEIEQLMAQFKVHKFPQNAKLSYKEMEQQFNFDGAHWFYRWNGSLVVTMVGASIYMMAPDSFYSPESGIWGKEGNGPETSGSFCYANLQILRGSLIPRGPAKEVTAETALIYREVRR